MDLAGPGSGIHSAQGGNHGDDDGLLRIPGRALDALPHDEGGREPVCSAAAHFDSEAVQDGRGCDDNDLNPLMVAERHFGKLDTSSLA